MTARSFVARSLAVLSFDAVMKSGNGLVGCEGRDEHEVLTRSIWCPLQVCDEHIRFVNLSGVEQFASLYCISFGNIGPKS